MGMQPRIMQINEPAVDAAAVASGLHRCGGDRCRGTSGRSSGATASLTGRWRCHTASTRFAVASGSKTLGHMESDRGSPRRRPTQLRASGPASRRSALGPVHRASRKQPQPSCCSPFGGMLVLARGLGRPPDRPSHGLRRQPGSWRRKPLVVLYSGRAPGPWWRGDARGPNALDQEVEEQCHFADDLEYDHRG